VGAENAANTLEKMPIFSAMYAKTKDLCLSPKLNTMCHIGVGCWAWGSSMPKDEKGLSGWRRMHRDVLVRCEEGWRE